MGRVIAVALSKGGTGKTTTAVNLAHCLAMSASSVLLVDADTQGQAAFLLGVKPSAGLAELVVGEVEATDCLVKAREHLFLLAGGRALAGIKRLIDRKDFGGERTIAEALSPIASAFEYVIVDCGPGWDALSVNALFAADEVLSPVSCEALTLQGLAEFARSLAAIQRYKPSLRLRYILPTFADNRVRKTREIIEVFRGHYPQQLCSPIRYSVKLSQAAGHGQTIFEFAPDSRGAADYSELSEKVRDGEA
ncbi:MAG: ParA family protein [Chloroflexi bacterium]|nr:ParA family protein [Chloroflexota bacterium]